MTIQVMFFSFGVKCNCRFYVDVMPMLLQCLCLCCFTLTEFNILFVNLWFLDPKHALEGVLRRNLLLHLKGRREQMPTTPARAPLSVDLAALLGHVSGVNLTAVEETTLPGNQLLAPRRKMQLRWPECSPPASAPQPTLAAGADTVVIRPAGIRTFLATFLSSAGRAAFSSDRA